MAEVSRGRGTDPALSGGERLESWKEIAAYLKRDVSTVQRWENQEGLPVHRHMHHRLATVYAYRSELDAWWNNRRPRLEQQTQTGPSSRRLLWWTLGIAASTLIAVAVVLGLWRPWRPRLAFQQRDWVLIAKFENRTGEAIFDDTLGYALERELSNSQFVNILPPERVQDALLLMKKPRDAQLDLATAREVALRDGNTQTVLTGRIEKIGSSYAFTTLLVNPGDGAVLRSVSEEATGQDAVLSAVRRLSNRVRQNLGEELGRIQQQAQALEKATTPSLRALQFYSQGIAFVDRLDWNRAIPMFEQAVAADPDFASAHIYLAHCYSNLNKTQQAAPHYQRAFQLADTTTDRERYFILGSYYDRFLGDLNKAVEDYEVLVRLYPDYFWGVNNLADTLLELGRAEEALPYIIARVELRPNDLRVNFWAWNELDSFRKDPVQAKRYLERAQHLATPEAAQRYPWHWTEVQLARADDHLGRLEFPQALAEIERVAKAFEAQERLARDPRAVSSLADRYRYLGRLHTAERYYNELPADWRHFLLSSVAELRADRKAFRDHLQKQIAAGGETVGPATAALCARAGLVHEARKILSSPRMSKYLPVHLEIARGELALAEGRLDDAAEQLRQAFSLAQQNRAAVLWASNAMARAVEARGDLPGATDALQQGLKENPFPWRLEDIAWNKFQLLRLYRKLGHEPEARELEKELRNLLAYADPNHPILLQLNSTARHQSTN